MKNCPFCNPDQSNILIESEHGLALSDGFPVTKGHSLVVPKKHVSSIFDLNEIEISDLWNLLSKIREELSGDTSISGFNVGINDGEAAGQTVEHAHIHLIPRRREDCENPRGGIRLLFPEKAKYWE